MRKGKFRWLMVALAVMLLGLFWIQYYWITTSMDLKEEEFDRTAKAALEKARTELQDDYYCFKLYSNVALRENEGFYMRRHLVEDRAFINEHQHPEAMDTVMTYLWNTYGEDTLYQTNRFRFSAPVDLRIELSFNYNAYRTALIQDTAGGMRDGIIEAYANTIIDSVTQDQVVDTVVLDSVLYYSFQNAGITADYAYAVYSPKRDEVFYSKGSVFPPSWNTSNYKIKLYNDKTFGNDYTLSLFFPQRNEYIVSSLWLVWLGSALIVILLGWLFAVFVRMFLKQQKLSELKSEFLNNMSHEFNTPLSNINLALSTIRKKHDVNGSGHYLDIIEDENRRLQDNVSRFLQAAQIDDEGVSLNRKPLDVVLLCEQVIRLFDLKIEESGGSITLRSESSEIVAWVDETHFTNTVYNLVDNAIKYSGVPIIQVALERKGKMLAVEVRDEGIGMTESEAKKIFDRFHRVPTGMRHDVQGFGLGLTYSKSVIDRHHGRIEVKSRKNVGSVFTILIPLR